MAIRRDVTRHLRTLLEQTRLHEIPCSPNATATFKTEVSLKTHLSRQTSFPILDLQEEHLSAKKALQVFEETFRQKQEVIVGSAQTFTPNHHAIITLYTKEQCPEIPGNLSHVRINELALEFEERRLRFFHTQRALVSNVKIIHHDYWN